VVRPKGGKGVTRKGGGRARAWAARASCKDIQGGRFSGDHKGRFRSSRSFHFTADKDEGQGPAATDYRVAWGRAPSRPKGGSRCGPAFTAACISGAMSPFPGPCSRSSTAPRRLGSITPSGPCPGLCANPVTGVRLSTSGRKPRPTTPGPILPSSCSGRGARGRVFSNGPGTLQFNSWSHCGGKPWGPS